VLNPFSLSSKFQEFHGGAECGSQSSPKSYHRWLLSLERPSWYVHLDLFPYSTFTGFDIYVLVLGLPHPAVNTRDVALYLPFRNSLNSGNHVPGLQTLAQRFLGRNCQQGHIEPVSMTRRGYRIADSSCYQTENARVCMDLYRSDPEWEASVARGNWACALPPSTFSRCYL